MTKYRQKYSVTCADIDLNSQMQPLAIPIYFQDCFIRYAAKNYFATFDLKSRGLYWFIADYNIHMEEDLPFWSENFYVEIWISKISKLKVYVDFVYTYKNKSFVKGRSTWILFNKDDNKPVGTDVLFKDYTDKEDELIEMQEKVLWNDIQTPIRTVEHLVNRTDLDFNEHVNNCSYVNIAITTASGHIQENYCIKKLAVKFLKQAFLKDKLICVSYSTSKEKEFITNINTLKEDICKIYTAWQPKSHNHNILDCNLEVRN